MREWHVLNIFVFQAVENQIHLGDIFRRQHILNLALQIYCVLLNFVSSTFKMIVRLHLACATQALFFFMLYYSIRLYMYNLSRIHR